MSEKNLTININVDGIRKKHNIQLDKDTFEKYDTINIMVSNTELDDEQNIEDEVCYEYNDRIDVDLSDTELKGHVSHIIGTEKFDDGFNIMITQQSDTHYVGTELCLFGCGYNAMYSMIKNIDTKDMKNCEHKIINHDYTKDNIPVSHCELPYDLSECSISLVLYTGKEGEFSRLKTYKYRLFPNNNDIEYDKYGGDDKKYGSAYFTYKIEPKRIIDKNDPTLFGIKPPNIELIFEDNDVKLVCHWENY